MRDRLANPSQAWSFRVDDADGLSLDSPIRYDRGELLSAVRRPDGSILAEGWAARAGILEYRRTDGSIRRELVTEDTLRNGLATLGRVAVTNTHPRDDRGDPIQITPENVGRYGVGDVDGDVSIEEGGFVRVRIAVRRRDALDALDAGRAELSPGYAVALDETPGVHPVYGRYDAVQVARLYNHLAIVDRARGGAEVRLRVDDARLSGQIRRSDSNTRRATVHPSITRILALLALGGQTYADDDQALAAIVSHLAARADSVDPALTKARADLATVTAERDTARADLATVTAERDTMKADAAERAAAAERERLAGVARAYGVKADEHPEIGNLRRAIAEGFLGSPVKADADDAYLAALIDLAESRIDPSRTDGGRAGDAGGAGPSVGRTVSGSGRAAGRAAWRESQAARTDEGNTRARGAGEINRSRYDAAFEAGRSGGGE